MAGVVAATTTHLFAMEIGAFGFGAVLGWNAYFINRYRKDVVIGDLAAIISAVGGSAILALFKAETVLFAFYGMGLAVGFFGYFVVLIILVTKSAKYDVDWLIGGEGRPMLGAGDLGERRPDPPL
jgi:hypothetical protein